MNRNGKRILATAISASSLLVVALVIVIILAIVQKWDIAGALTSPTAYLVYGIIGVGLVFGIGMLARYLASGRY